MPLYSNADVNLPFKMTSRKDQKRLNVAKWDDRGGMPS
jgi:hypothetical protein